MLDRIPNPPAGMLRRGSPVFSLEERESVPGRMVHARGLWCPSGPKADEGIVCWDLSSGTRPRTEFPVYIGRLALDLTDATGRAHCAAWIRAQALASGVRFVGLDIQALCKAAEFAHMTPTEIDLLARLALRIMGRTP